MKKVVVTGGNGQLGECIRAIAPLFPKLHFEFVDIDELNIADGAAVEKYFDQHQPDYCVNAAAYTNVEKAESESDLAFEVNAAGARNIANACAATGSILCHISTDYVFNGNTDRPYTEEDNTDPINEYGASKLKGEEYVKNSGCDYFIFRTSWLYSQYGHNFYKTILRVAGEGKPLTITTEQTGVPTNANDLAESVLKIIDGNSKEFGTYHFSNAGEATWYDFAEAILEESGLIEASELAKTNHYRTFAARPVYSVMNTEKISNLPGIEIKDWRLSLRALIKENNSTN